MAEIMKPPALDESLNTTEVQSRNVADVLAQELQNLASSVKPSADEIDFDNTGTSLSSTDVEGAIKEIVTESTSTVSVSQGLTATRNEISKCGCMTTLNLRISKISPTTKNWIILGTIPEGFRPKSDIDYLCANNETNTSYLFCVGRILSTGELRIWGINGTDITPYISLVYQS